MDLLLLTTLKNVQCSYCPLCQARSFFSRGRFIHDFVVVSSLVTCSSFDDFMKAVACKVLHQLISSGNKCWMQHARKFANNCPSFGFMEKNRKLFMISKLVATVVWQPPPPPQIQFAMP
jgi:hypothetical protein